MDTRIEPMTTPDPTEEFPAGAHRADQASDTESGAMTGWQRVLHRLGAARVWFRAFRRTRPFWGSLWAILGGAWIIKMMDFTFYLVVTGGWSYAAGYVMGGGMALFGLISMVKPEFKNISGLIVFLLALVAFPTANLGGFLVGTILGIIGGSMIWSWGEKKPRRGASDQEAT